MSATEQPAPPRVESYNNSQNKRRRLITAATILVLTAALVVLFAFNPTEAGFYPVCVFKKMTGWSCPACGCLRATHQLLHGNFATAFHLNPLYIVIIPFVALLGMEQFLRKPLVKKPAFLGWTLLALFVVFGIVRNLPAFSAWSGQ